jgi:DNA-binding MarR family transcriptional regulator
MEAEGFVRCEARQTDGRFTDVSLTAAGKQARERTLAIAGKLYEVAFSGMENPERDRLNATLQGVFDRLGGG